ncbi:U1 small nuclear ribonucleoprotein C-2 [Wallemia ichthyophaga EXF-994]|uniref:U1 small nuclear ribonucleoprotein C-2 n=1 Tax=Wallemia ichthyophaga (strain EXF-994 / CBS 113033) TaxID=1299270 RepID=R9ACX6_WALI9|nr:U1 small nuclear ribonucleoprotein C-2 [Wallemia ichthyophaga EXF-994]EOR00022.1 U1 small nuclear ribonucleoprotein C-2 [Wallemia ichthyophaga EXF-994]
MSSDKSEYWIDKVETCGLEGVELFEYRRKLWTQPTKTTQGHLIEREKTPSIVKLIQLIDNAKDKENYTDIWDKGISRIYENLVQGNRLLQPLPLEIIVIRKAHNSGRNHLINVKDYYASLGHDKAQFIIDEICRIHESGLARPPPALNKFHGPAGLSAPPMMRPPMPGPPPPPGVRPAFPMRPPFRPPPPPSFRPPPPPRPM